MLNLRRLRFWLGTSAVAGLVAFSSPISGAADGQPSTWPASPPQLKQGEIVIKPTGRKRVIAVRPAAPAARLEPDGDLGDGTPRRRAVTIGYFVRDPGETGWGPQIHWAPYAYPSYSHNACGGGYSGLGHSGLLFGSSGGCYGGSRDIGFHAGGRRHVGFGHGGSRYAPRSAGWRR